MEVDMNKIRILAESAERRAKELHAEYEKSKKLAFDHRQCMRNLLAAQTDVQTASLLNDFFYWSGKATSYRGIIAMAELQMIVEDELDAEGSCP